MVIENGALPLLVEFTGNKSVDLKEQVKILRFHLKVISGLGFMGNR